MLTNAQVATALSELATLMDLTGEDGFRVNAHARAARTLEGLSEEVCGVAPDRARLTAIPGIGAKLADKIVEICTTGVLAELNALRAKVPAGLMDILQVPGLGPKTVRAMWEAGITDIPGLRKAIDDGSLLKLPRMGEKAVAKIRESLAFAAQASQRTHLGKAGTIADRFVTELASLPGVARVKTAGSLRRGRETIGDIDVLVAMKARSTAAEASAVASTFVGIEGVMQVISQGESKCSVRVSMDGRFGRWKPEGDVDTREEKPAAGPSIQVDLRILPVERFGSALMYFTGSKEHNVRLRERALSMGLTLSEWGLFPHDKHADKPPQERGVTPVAAATEEEVYAKLDLPFIPPEAREDRGELDVKGPWRLLEVEDVKAELHAHTTASDGAMSIVELAEEAKRRGFHTIAVTDHSQSSTIANGLKPDRLRKHIAAVREAAAEVKGITILAGSEVDILANGSLDYDDDLLAQLDVVVASPHAALSQDPATATERLLTAVRHPLVHILGHPTGRLILRRPGLSPDMAAIIAAAKACDVALEINSHWMRLDLRDVHVRAATDAGCLIAVNCDDHERSDFDNLRYGVQTARRGWVTPDLCVNAWDKKRLHAWLKRKR